MSRTARPAVQEFSFDEYMRSDAVRAAREAANNDGAYLSTSADWLGVKSVENLPSVVAIISKAGDLATTRRVESCREKCASTVPNSAKNIRPVWNGQSLMGTRVNMSDLLEGKPRAFGRFERKRTSHEKVISVYVPIGGLGDLSAEEIGWAAVAGIVCVDLLEQAGYRCEVWGASCSDGDYGPTAIRVKLKEASDPADVSSIARVAHPAIFRGLMLALRRDYGGNRTCDIDPSMWEDAHGKPIKHAYSEGDAVREVARFMAEFK